MKNISRKVTKLAEKINSTPGAREIVIPVLEGKITQEGVVLDSLVDLTKRHISSIIARKAELKDKRKQLSEQLSGHTKYRVAAEAAKEAAKVKAEMKKQVLQDDKEARLLDDDIKGLSHDVKEKQLSLFDYLLEYHNRTQSTEIVDNAGTRHEIQIEAKIKI